VDHEQTNAGRPGKWTPGVRCLRLALVRFRVVRDARVGVPVEVDQRVAVRTVRRRMAAFLALLLHRVPPFLLVSVHDVLLVSHVS
jgi:hypothetical protein